MKFKEFVSWCNDRAADGCWGSRHAMICIDVIHDVRKEPFWKREKYWKETYENQVVISIINPINDKIQELHQN